MKETIYVYVYMLPGCKTCELVIAKLLCAETQITISESENILVQFNKKQAKDL